MKSIHTRHFMAVLLIAVMVLPLSACNGITASPPQTTSVFTQAEETGATSVEAMSSNELQESMEIEVAIPSEATDDSFVPEAVLMDDEYENTADVSDKKPDDTVMSANKTVDNNVPISNDAEVDEHIHDYLLIMIAESTCTGHGGCMYECAICGETYWEEYPLIGHMTELVPQKEPTCTEDGFEAYYQCWMCGKLFLDVEAEHEISEPVVILATGHDWDEWIETTAACEADGEATRVCRNDSSHVETKAVPMHGHDWAYFSEDIPAGVGIEGHIRWYCAYDPSHTMDVTISALD